MTCIPARLVRLTIAAIVLSGCFATAALARERTQQEPALWRLADEDSEVWLFGTIHVLPPGVTWQTVSVDAALKSAETVYLETPLDPESQQVIAELIETLGLFQDSSTLSGLLGEEDKKRLARVAEALGLPVEALQPLRPWFASVSLSMRFMVMQGADPTNGVDLQIQRQAADTGKELKFFETGEEQLRFFADLPRDIELGLLIETLKQIETQPDLFASMFAAWQSGDVNWVGEVLNEDMRKRAPEVYARLVLERNTAWADRITDIMDGSGTVFIAVGAAHLAGIDSVVRLLSDRGLQAERQ